MNQNQLQELETLARKVGSEYSADDKFFIKAISEDLGVAFKPRANCKECYSDQAKILLKKVREQKPAASDRAYELLPDVDVIWRNIRVNNETLTDEIAEQMIADGFPRLYFAKCK